MTVNNARRKEIAAISATIAGLGHTLDDVVGSIESVRDDEQAYLDDMPESFQSGEKGECAQAAIDALEEAISTIEELDLDAICDHLEAACE
jgi:hypothetical protein